MTNSTFYSEYVWSFRPQIEDGKIHQRAIWGPTMLTLTENDFGIQKSIIGKDDISHFLGKVCKDKAVGLDKIFLEKSSLG